MAIIIFYVFKIFWNYYYNQFNARISTKKNFSDANISILQTTPVRFNHIMSGNCFESIIKFLIFHKNEPQTFEDNFFEVRELVDSFNEHMEKILTPSWANCLDESMSLQINKQTCPGFTHIPHKPHPKENEFHTIACGLSLILWRLKLRKGKDRPRNLPK